MNANSKTRVSASLTCTLGRQFGVLPVDPRLRATKKITSSGTGAKIFGSETTSGKRRSIKRTESRTPTHLDVCEDDYEYGMEQNQLQRIQSRSEPSPQGESHQGSSCQASSGRSLSKKRSQSTEEEGDKDDQPKKNIEPHAILELCQEKEYHRVYDIHLHGEDLTKIPDLEKFRKVRALDLSCNHIKKIHNLDFNQDLRELKLYGNGIAVIENLDNLKELCSLQLQHNKVRSIGRGLSCLKKLRSLRLDSNCLLRLETSDLVGCVQIAVLDLSSNMLDNLAALNYLPNLEELHVANNRLRKVTDIHRCKKLQEVNLSGNRITDLIGLAGLQQLQILDVSNNQLSSLKSLGRLRSLVDLNVTANRLSELEYFTHSFPQLQILQICDNTISDWQQVSNLSAMSELVEIYMTGNPVSQEDGETAHYHTAILTALPNIEVVDGAHIKSQSSKSVPFMRPMSASSIVSLRQIDSQFKVYAEEFRALEKTIVNKFASLRATCETLPASAVSHPIPARHSSPLFTTSRSGSRARLREAMDFVAQNSDMYTT